MAKRVVIGPNGERRPRDPVASAVMVMQIATGERTETDPSPCESPKRPRRARPSSRTAADEGR